MLSHKRLAVVVTGAFAALALSVFPASSAGATAQPTPSPSESGAATEEFGPGCDAIPTDPSNPGSFEAMATEPVATALAANPEIFSMLVAAVNNAGLTDSLNDSENITVFAPINDAFAKIPAEDLNAILADPDLLVNILGYHVLPETITPDKLVGTHQTLQGDSLTVTGSGTDFIVNNTATVVCGNVKTANATVYAIDGVILPS